MSGALFSRDPFRPPVHSDGMHPPRPARTNLLLAAAIETRMGALAVRVRNLSEGGAMLEGDALPNPGDPLVLVRGNLRVAGMCVWNRGQRCGVKLDRPISVAQWSAMRGATSAGQQRIDVLQATIRNGEALTVPASSDAPCTTGVVHNVADELANTAQALRAIADRLSDDMAVITAHGDILQNLDPLSQTLDHLARILSAPDPAPVIDTIGMDDLRLRLMRPASNSVQTVM